MKSEGNTPVQCVDHLVPLSSEFVVFLSLGLELNRDLPSGNEFFLISLVGLRGM